MREKLARSYFGCHPEASEDGLSLSAVCPPELKSLEHDFCVSGEDVYLEGCELKDVCSMIEDDDLVEIVKDREPLKPVGSFGSFRQRHDDGFVEVGRSEARKQGCVNVMSTEAPASLEFGVVRRGNLSHDCLEACKLQISELSPSNEFDPPRPVNISCDRSHAENKVLRRVQKQRSFSTDIDREEAWERKKDLYLIDKLSYAPQRTRAVSRSASDCGDRNWPKPVGSGRFRTLARTLTDEDLEELRGCIDLGFGFSHDESHDLTNTLPALELYHAINRQYADIKNRSSPSYPCDGVMLDRTSSGGSPRSPLGDSWRITSPGDDPSQVKARLRHWAQAVACSVKQGV